MSQQPPFPPQGGQPQSPAGYPQQAPFPPQGGQPQSPTGEPQQPPTPGPAPQWGSTPGAVPQQKPMPWGPNGPHQPGQSPRPVTNLADGEWHRADPLTPWASFFAGLGVLIPLAFVFVVPAMLSWLEVAGGDNLRGTPTIIGLPMVLFVGIVAVSTLIWPFISYRVSRFRVGAEVFEYRTGVLNKQHRQVRLDRLQSVNLNRSLIARMFGLTVLETSGAGTDSDIKLQYLKAGDAEALRAELLQRASGARRAKTEQRLSGNAAAAGIAAPAVHGAPMPTGAQTVTGAPARPQRIRRTLADFVDVAVLELSNFDQETAPDHAVVRVSPKRIALSTLMSTGLVSLIVLVLVAIPLLFVIPMLTDDPGTTSTVTIIGLAVTFVPMLFAVIAGVGGALLSNLQYTIAGTPDGVRVGRGVLSQNSDTVAPGRIHSVQVNQPFYWKPFGWYSLTVNRADLQQQADTDKNDQQLNAQRHTLLPVGTLDEVARVLQLVLPMHMSDHTLALVTDGMGGGRVSDFVAAPARAWWLRPLGFRRYGYAIDRGVMYLRSGWMVRRLAIIPGERMQGVSLHSGPIRRLVRVVTMSPDTVGGPVKTFLPLVDADTATELFERVERLAIEAADADTSHRWREAQARLSVAAAHMEIADAARAGRAPSPQALAVIRAEDEWRRTVGLPPEPADTAAEPIGENQLPPLPPAPTDPRAGLEDGPR